MSVGLVAVPRKAVPQPARSAVFDTALQIRDGWNFGVRAASVPLCGTRDTAFECSSAIKNFTEA